MAKDLKVIYENEYNKTAQNAPQAQLPKRTVSKTKAVQKEYSTVTQLSPPQITTITSKSGSLGKKSQNVPQNIQNFMDGEL